MMPGVDERTRRAADRHQHALRAVRRTETLRARSLWLLSSSRAILQRPNGLIRGGAFDEAAAFRPTLFLGQPVRHIDRTEIGIVIGLLFGEPEHALVRWASESTFEVVEELVEVLVSSTWRRSVPASPPPASPTAGG